MGVKMQRQMDKVIKVLNPINMANNMTAFTKMTKTQKFCIFMSHCLMKSDGVDRMFPFAKRDISKWGSRYEPKIN